MYSKNVPRQNYGDVAYAWRRCYTQLQTDLWSQMEWMEGLQECTKRAQTKDVRFPTSKEVRSLKQLMEGLVIGPLDKNNGEMWMTCPELYDRALTPFPPHSASSRVGSAVTFCRPLEPPPTGPAVP